MSGFRKRLRSFINRIGRSFRRRKRSDENHLNAESEELSNNYLDQEQFTQEQQNDFNPGSSVASEEVVDQSGKGDDSDTSVRNASSPSSDESTDSSDEESDNNDDSFKSSGYIPLVSATEESGQGELVEELGIKGQEKSEIKIKDYEEKNEPTEKIVQYEKKGPHSVVVVNGQEFDVDRTLLSTASTYFQEAFAGPDNKQLVLHINSEITTSVVFEAISSFIDDGFVEIPSKEFLNLMVSSKIFGMPRLYQHCVQLLDPSTDEVQNLLNFYQVSCQLKQERAPVLKRLAHHFEELMFEDDFLALTSEQVIEILSQDEIGARSEVVVFVAALEWINYNFLEREECIVKIFRCIRFTNMTMAELVACFHPAILPGVIEMAEIKSMLLDATCYLCAKAVHQEHLFGHLKSQPRTLLRKDEFLALWNTDMFDPNYTKNVAATKIQAAYRGYRTRKQLLNNDDPKIRKCYSDMSMRSFFESEIRKEMCEEMCEETPRYEYPESETKNYKYFLKRMHKRRQVFPEDLE